MQVRAVMAISILEATGVSTPKGVPVFVVSSDVAILKGLSYSSENNTLSFIAVAPEGASGKIYVYISNSLVASPPKFNVMVDGTILEHFTVESVPDGYLLTFTLLFSIHKVDVQLGPQPKASKPDFSNYILPLIIIIAISFMAVLIVRLRAKKRCEPRLNSRP